MCIRDRFYAERGFQNEPQRCKACRDARKNAARGPREFFTAVCALSLIHI